MDKVKASVVAPKLKQITFLGDHDIRKDDNSGKFAGPQWLDANLDGDAEDAGDHQYPVAYTRSQAGDKSFLQVEAIIQVEGLSENMAAQIRGTGPDEIKIEASSATQAINGSLSTYTINVTVDDAFVDTVKYYSSFTIDWEISLDGGPWRSVGTSDNKLYLTWDDPVANPLTWTVLHVGTEAANGTGGTVGTNDNLVLNEIWNKKLSQKNIQRISDGEVLDYYGYDDVNGNGAFDAGDTDHNDINSCTNTTYELLVAGGYGTCHAWADFMIGTLEAQGLDEVNGNKVRLTTVVAIDNPNNRNDSAKLAIKGWTKNADPTNPGSYKVVNDNAGVDGSMPVVPGVGEAADAIGTPGKGNSPNPPAIFRRHFIIHVGPKNKEVGSWYDPSYGLGPYTDPKQYELNAFEGQIKDVNGERRLFDQPNDNGELDDDTDRMSLFSDDGFNPFDIY